MATNCLRLILLFIASSESAVQTQEGKPENVSLVLSFIRHIGAIIMTETFSSILASCEGNLSMTDGLQASNMNRLSLAERAVEQTVVVPVIWETLMWRHGNDPQHVTMVTS